MLKVTALLSTLIFLYTGQINAQNSSSIVESVSLSQMMDKAITQSKGEVLIENSNITIKNPQLTKRRGLVKYLSDKYPKLVDSLGRVNIPNALTINNCRFDQNIYLHKINFANGLTITDSHMTTLKLSDSKSSVLKLTGNNVAHEIALKGIQCSGIDLSFNELGHLISINNSRIDGEIKVNNNVIEKGEIRLLASEITNGSLLMGDNLVLAEIIEGCDIILSAYSDFNHFELPGTPPTDLYVVGNTIQGDSTSHISFSKGNYLNLNVRDNIFHERVYFIENKVEERFFLVNNDFKKYVSFEKFLFSEIWNELYWDQFAGRKLRYQDYGATESADFFKKEEYNNLINIYKGMHTIFTSRGNLKSANACYSEMKELQGKMHRHIYQQNPTFGNFLRWQLNVLLKIYTNHGTDPGLAVVMSCYVIVLFSLLYIFFPSEWDKDSRSRLKTSYDKLRARKRRKAWMPLLMIVGTLIFSLINAITLSINSFVTLGFGSIPTSGFARYLCIIEGFIGWFLLSIFSVALINQVLA